MQAYSVKLPHFTVGQAAYAALTDILKPWGKKVAILGGKTALSKALPTLEPALEHAGATILGTHVYGEDSTMTNVHRLMELTSVKEADVLVAVGGGRAIDTVKTVADLLDKPYLSVPTVASNCAPVTAIAVIYKDDGSLDHYHFCRQCPAHTFIDLDVILDSPYALFWAGIGDALSKQIEVLFASKGHELFHTPLLGVQLAQACEEPLLQYGLEALADFESKRVTHAFTEVVLDIIISTGMVSNLVTDKRYYYNSSLAHCFYNAYTRLPMAHEHLHGEVVSFGNLVLLAFTGQEERLQTYLRFNKAASLPVKLEDIGMTTEDLENLVQYAPAINEWKLCPVPITENTFKEAVLRVDRLGQALP